MPALEAIGPHLGRVAQDWSDWSSGVDHGAQWLANPSLRSGQALSDTGRGNTPLPSPIVGAEHHSVEAEGKVVDIALDMSGSLRVVRAIELERLYRDVRCGRFPPANSALVHEIVGKTTPGVGLDEQPRWGLTPRGTLTLTLSHRGEGTFGGLVSR